MCRDLLMNQWDANSSSVTALRKAFNTPVAEATHYYSPFGIVNASFLLGKLLGIQQENLSLIRTSELSWQQLANNDVVFVGNEDRYEAALEGMPIRPQLTLGPRGVRDLHPASGEPAEFLDQVDPDSGRQNGTAYALVSHIAGPLGTTNVEVFTSRSSWGYLGAVQWFTDTRLASTLVAKLRRADGHLPEYYQVLLKIEFKDQVPIQTSFVLSRELH